MNKRIKNIYYNTVSVANATWVELPTDPEPQQTLIVGNDTSTTLQIRLSASAPTGVTKGVPVVHGAAWAMSEGEVPETGHSLWVYQTSGAPVDVSYGWV